MTHTTDDERLLVEAAQADPARFVELYDRYVDRIYAFVSRRTANRADAEDVTSQVFEQALRSIGQFQWRGVPVAAWLFRIAANALADHWRRRGPESHEAPPDVPDATEAEDIDRRLALYRHVADPDAAYQRAVGAGATSIMPMSNEPYGRVAGVEDYTGNQWFFARPAIER